MRYFLMFFTLVLLVNCSSVPKEYLTNDDIRCYNNSVFKISNEEFNFDIEQHFKEIKRQTKVITDTPLQNIRFIMWEDGEITNKQTNKQLKISKWIDYRKNGSIKSSQFIYLNGNKPIFKETHYDNQGNITKIIDYEKGYNICWAEAIAIVKKIAKKDIEKYEVTGFYLPYRVDLNEFPNEKPEWGVLLEGNDIYKLKDRKVYWIDGVTGKFLRTTKITTSYD